jgi:hypothetical protein
VCACLPAVRGIRLSQIRKPSGPAPSHFNSAARNGNIPGSINSGTTSSVSCLPVLPPPPLFRTSRPMRTQNRRVFLLRPSERCTLGRVP